MKKKVAIQGIAGSYHDIAARNYFEGEEIEIIGCNTFRDVISTIKKDPSILGMMAIENTIAVCKLSENTNCAYPTRWLHFQGPISTMSKKSTLTRSP